MSTRRYIMREQIKKILELYEQGLSLGEICETMGLTPGEFNRLLKKRQAR